MLGIFQTHSSSAEHLLMSSAVNVDLDPTFFIHFILFGAFVVIMKDLIFDPMIKVFERREKMTTGEIEEGRTMDEEAIKIKEELDEKLDSIRREAAADREVVRARVKKVETELLDSARNAMTSKLDEGMSKLHTEVKAIEADLEKERAPLAAAIASKVLGREVDAKEARA